MTRSLQFFSWYSIPALRLNASIKAVSCNTCNWGKTLLKNDIIIKYELYLQNRGQIVFKQIISSEMPTSGDLKSGDFFWTSTPPPQPNLPMHPPPSSFLIWTPPPPPPPPLLPTSNFVGRMSIYLSGTSIIIGWILIQSDSHFYRCNKEDTLFFLFATKMCIMQENEARNCNTSISQIILEFWNIWSLNLSFLWATDPNFLLSGSFGHP